jgi:rhodanese-related sulfurtransferase
MYLINVLSPEAYEDCHIKGSINVPLDTLAEYSEKLPKNAEIIVQCASYVCPMSRRAWRLLKDKGFTNVKAYEGGTAEWYALGLPTEGPAHGAYLKEHYEKSPAPDDVEIIDIEELKEKLAI